MQTRLKSLNIERKRKNYPQVDYIDNNGVQWIELNRGCRRQCSFCYADPNFKEFPIPKIRSNKVQIIGEGFLYDSRLPTLIDILPYKYNGKIVYYGFSQGLDYHGLSKSMIDLLSQAHCGLITNKGRWKKGMRIAWDWGKEKEDEIYRTLKRLDRFGYKRKDIIIFVLVNWKIDFKTCLYKLKRFKEWGVMIDDCTWDCTKTLFIPQYWDYPEYRKFRAMCRDHNIRIPRKGYNPEKRK